MRQFHLLLRAKRSFPVSQRGREGCGTQRRHAGSKTACILRMVGAWVVLQAIVVLVDGDHCFLACANMRGLYRRVRDGSNHLAALAFAARCIHAARPGQLRSMLATKRGSVLV